jgi:hypothetical protein
MKEFMRVGRLDFPLHVQFLAGKKGERGRCAYMRPRCTCTVAVQNSLPEVDVWISLYMYYFSLLQKDERGRSAHMHTMCTCPVAVCNSLPEGDAASKR